MWQMSQVFHSYIHCRLDPVDATNYQCLSRRSCNELIRISWRWLAMYETVCHMLCKTILARCWARNSAKSRKNSCELCIAIRSVVVAKLLVLIIIINHHNHYKQPLLKRSWLHNSTPANTNHSSALGRTVEIHRPTFCCFRYYMCPKKVSPLNILQ